MIMENNDVQLLKRARHAVPKLSIITLTPVMRRKVLSADGSYGHITVAVGLGSASERGVRNTSLAG